MKTTKIKNEKSTVDRFSVIVNKEEVLTTSEQNEAVQKINEQFEKQTPLIILIDRQSEISTHYSKTINQRNYRIFQGNYQEDLQLLNSTEVVETDDQNLSESINS